MNEWIPKTELGKLVYEGKIKHIDEILDRGIRIKEPEIVDKLIPNLEVQLLNIGQAKGKFGGGRRKPFRVTQRKTEDGNKPKFSVMAVVGNRNGYIGLGFGASSETMPAREKAIREAKLNLIKIRRGCGSWQCGCGTPHSIPFKIIYAFTIDIWIRVFVSNNNLFYTRLNNSLNARRCFTKMTARF